MSYAYRIAPDKCMRLRTIETDEDHGLEKKAARRITSQLGAEMQELLRLLSCAREHSLLLVVQGRDASGKDGLIRHLLAFANVQTCHVAAFKVPSAEELSHDFLWRIHRQAPARGGVTIFNRSHYEDVLVARVHRLVPEDVWRRRYDHINCFERMLADAGTILLKFYLHVSAEEQVRRLTERDERPDKAWKLSAADWQERARWHDYDAAYEDALHRCSTAVAPWFVVPADRKWYRDLAVTAQIVDELRPYRECWEQRLIEMGEEAKARLVPTPSALPRRRRSPRSPS